MNNINPANFIKNYMLKGMTPKGLVKQLAGNNPILSNLIDMAEKGDNKGVENFARNMLKERGMDLDKELSTFKNSLK